jgi:hypothetical protein
MYKIKRTSDRARCWFGRIENGYVSPKRYLFDFRMMHLPTRPRLTMYKIKRTSGRARCWFGRIENRYVSPKRYVPVPTISLRSRERKYFFFPSSFFLLATEQAGKRDAARLSVAHCPQPMRRPGVCGGSNSTDVCCYRGRCSSGQRPPFGGSEYNLTAEKNGKTRLQQGLVADGSTTTLLFYSILFLVKATANPMCSTCTTTTTVGCANHTYPSLTL